MRSLATSALLAVATLLPAQASSSDQPATLPALHVALVAAPDSERGESLEVGLRGRGMRVRRIAPADCAPTAFWNVDAVIVDWPADRKLEPAQHGAFLRWHRPTLFFSDAGARFATAWHLPTAKQIAALDVAQRGPAMQLREFEKPGPMAIWRHGNLFYLPDDMPEQLASDRLDPFVTCLRWASQFVTDRPVVRFSAPDDVERRDRVAALADQLKVEIGNATELQALPARLRTKDERAARTLLASCLEGGPAESTSLNNWKNWMRPRIDGMHWDSLSHMWRVDELAHWRGIASSELRGEQRSDGGVLDQEAIAIATKTVKHYGGRALADLQTFSCWHGELFYMWDRRRGYFRVECHVTKFARATPWKASAMDTFTDKQLVWGNGGTRRGPRIASRGMYRDMIERTFLPLMLLDPGIKLRYLKDESTTDEAILRVRLAGRGLELKTDYDLTIARETGAVIRFQERGNSRLQQVFEFVASETCGPLTLPTHWRVQMGRRTRDHKLEDLAWNPKLPQGIESATDRLTTPRTP